ncbi:unnamed protein product [Victoria cruziana]
MADSSPLIAEEALVDGKASTLTLSASGRIEWRGRSSGCLSVDADVLGYAAEGSALRIRAFLKKSGGGCCGHKDIVRERRDVVLEPSSEESLGLWCERLRQCVDSLARPKNLLIIVNPYGGRRSASKIFQNEVAPLLAAADVKYTLEETQHRLHAKEIAHGLDISKYDGIVCVSGDGTIAEVINGLLQREDWLTAIKMPIGIIPAGTGNGMAKSLLDSVEEACVASNATFAVIRGHKRALDVATVLQEETRFFSVLMLSWGIIADIDIESEKYRWMGSARVDFYSIVRMIHLRQYNGRVSFVPAPGYEGYGNPVGGQEESLSRLNSLSKRENRQNAYLGPMCSFEPQEWRSYDGPFISVWLHNVPWGSETVMPAPDAKFSDGYLDMVLVRDSPKLALLETMTSLNDGSHVKSPHVLYLKVKAFYLEPGQRANETDKGGIIDCDGEVLARGKGTFKFGQQQDVMAYGPPIYLTVDKGLATLFSPK